MASLHANPGGGHFTRTSQDIRLKDGCHLSALCKTLAGQWVASTLDLDFYLENFDGTVQVAVTESRPGKFMISSQNLELATNGTTKLRGKAQRFDGTWKTFEFDLDDYVDNLDGKLSLGGGLFSRTSQQINFKEDGKLSALCKTIGGQWVPSTLDLNYHVKNDDGTLDYASPPPKGDFMVTSTDVKFTATNLSGSAKRKDFTWKHFQLELDYNIANCDGKLVWLVNPHDAQISPK